MRNIKKIKKFAKKKDKKINIKKAKKIGTISRKKRMRNGILVSFLIANLLIRKNCMDSI